MIIRGRNAISVIDRIFGFLPFCYSVYGMFD